MKNRTGTEEILRCSFCHKSQDAVAKLISSPSDYPRAYICDECVAVCNSILEDDRTATPPATTPNQLPKPQEVKTFLDEYVIGQEQTKKKLAVAVYNHYKRIYMNRQRTGDGIELTKSNIMLIGPTGTGKTLMAQTLARMLDVPFAIVDATTLPKQATSAKTSRTSSSSCCKRRTGRGPGADGHHLHRRSRQDRPKRREPLDHARCFRRGCAAGAAQDPGRNHRQRSSSGWAQASAPGIHPGRHDQYSLHLRRSFRRVGEDHWPPRGQKVPRFPGDTEQGAAEDSNRSARRNFELLSDAQPEDLIKFGLIPEFVGRLPVVGVLEDLDEAALIEILTRPKNAIIKQYQRLFEFENVRLKFSEDALRAISRQAMARKVGARGLRMILEELMLDLMYHLPSQKKVKEFEVTREMVEKRNVSLAMMEKAG